MPDSPRSLDPPGITDFHNHLMPGVDDGAQTVEDAVAALRSFHACGVRDVITTPHFAGSLTLSDRGFAERLEQLDRGWERLQIIAAEVPGIRVHRGAEVMLDVPHPALTDERLHLAGGRFVLVELPFMSVPPESSRILTNIRNRGLVPVLAHPERYHGVIPGSTLPLEWKTAGALLQVNGGSLLGKYGKGPRANAIDLLTRGLADYLCSDYHARGLPQVREYVTWLEERGAREQAHMLTIANPARLLRGELPLPIMPLGRAGRGWTRLLPWKKG